MNILSRQKGFTDVYHPSFGLTPKEISSVERYLDAIRSDLLFAKSVILVEGDAELILIPAMVKETLGISLDELGISLIKVDGTVFKHISNLFHEKRLKRKCAILTDLDSAYVKVVDDIFDADFVESLVDAEDDGLRRKEELDKYIEGNEFITVHYAENTFETELVRYDENNNLFLEVMKTEYKKEAYFKKAESDVNSSDLRVRYKRVLKFAKKIGKGWLATEMVEHLSVDNRVPDYILQAIQFVLRDRNVEPIYQKMLDYNMSLMGVKEFDCINAEKDFSSKMIEYKKHFNDSFVRLLEL